MPPRRRSGVAAPENQRFSPCEHFTTKRRRCGAARGKGRLQTLRVCFCGIITAKRLLYQTYAPTPQSGGLGNYTIHAPRSWYNNRKADIIPALCPHARSGGQRWRPMDRSDACAACGSLCAGAGIRYLGWENGVESVAEGGNTRWNGGRTGRCIKFTRAAFSIPRETAWETSGA